MRIQIVDPAAYTPPYDHALATALAGVGLDVELVTSKFAYGPVPRGEGYTVSERFYRRSLGAPGSRLRSLTRLAEHVPNMLAYRRYAHKADLVHFQWLSVQPLDVHLLPRNRPLVLTAHDVLPREPKPGQLAGQRKLYDRVDAVIVHSEHGRGRLLDALDLPSEKVHVVPHGAFDYLAKQPNETPLPPELKAVEKPVVLCFGLLRPYKGIELLLEAWRGVEDAELWVVGLPKMPLEPLRKLAPKSVRFVPRFVTDPEIPAYFRRADLVVLPYREIDQSGVLYTALAFGKPLLMTAVGGFPEVAATGAGELVTPGSVTELHEGLTDLLADPAKRGQLAAAAKTAAAGRYSWHGVAGQTATIYRDLLN